MARYTVQYKRKYDDWQDEPCKTRQDAETMVAMVEEHFEDLERLQLRDNASGSISIYR